MYAFHRRELQNRISFLRDKLQAVDEQMKKDPKEIYRALGELESAATWLIDEVELVMDDDLVYEADEEVQ